MEKIRWGILSTGNIAHSFTRDVMLMPDAEVVAVGSRQLESARDFAQEFGIPKAYGSYEALAQDPEVEVIYIGSPHSGHMEHSLLCLGENKAVLCEKPFAINAQQAQIMIDQARAKGVFLMEAMWTRFLPIHRALKGLLENGDIGQIEMLTADFGYRTEFDPTSRLFDPALGGGSLLDVGIYPISFAVHHLGLPDGIHTHAVLGETGVDERASYVFQYNSGAIALLHSALRTRTRQEATIYGALGYIELQTPFWLADEMTVHLPGKAPRAIREPRWGKGYTHQAQEVMDCLRAGQTESAIMPLSDTLAIMQVMDTIRAQWGLRYPMETSL